MKIKATYVGENPRYKKKEEYQWTVTGMTLYPLGLGQAVPYHSLAGFLRDWVDIQVIEE
jgi:hypothetical protein